MKSNTKELKPLSKKFRFFQEFFSIQFKVFKHYLKYRTFWTIAFTLSSIIDQSKSLVYAYFIGVLIDSVIQNIQQGSADLNSIQTNLFWFLVYSVFVAINRSMVVFSQKAISHHGNFLFERFYYQKLNTLSPADLSDSNVADNISRGKDNIYRTHELLENSISFISSFVVIISGSVIVFSSFPIILPIILFISLAKAYSTSKSEIDILNWKEKETTRRRVAQATSDFLVEESSDRLEFSVCGLLNFFDQKYLSFITGFIQKLLSFQKKLYLWILTFDILFALTSIGLLYYLFTEALTGQIGVGTVTFVFSTVGNLVSQVGDTAYRFSKTTAFVKAIGYVFNLLDYQPKIKDGSKTYTTKKNMAPSIKFQNVSFRYPGSSKNIFTNLNLEIRSGEKIAIVGENGAGKSTLIKLIARAYEVTDGKILVDGDDINSFKIDSWYKYLGVLFQEFAFYRHFSVKENIYCGDTSKPINEKRIKESAKYADADDFIKEYPNGYDEIMDPKFNGTTPSGGQKQKIAIARFFYRNAPLAIFDEPTSAIDAVSEAKIFNRIYDFFKDKTVIIVSHRFSTVRNADRIIVVEHGEIIEEGTHHELLALDGSYARAYRLQAEGYQ